MASQILKHLAAGSGGVRQFSPDRTRTVGRLCAAICRRSGVKLGCQSCRARHHSSHGMFTLTFQCGRLANGSFRRFSS
jgi:hypothetical protein